MKPLLFLAIFWSFMDISCITQKKCLQKFPPTSTHDSTYVEHINMVPILIEGDTLDINALIRCPDQDVLRVENGKLTQTIRILNGRLYALTLIKRDTVFVPVKETVIETREVKVPQPVKYVPPIYKYALGFSILVIVLFIAWLTKKFWI